MGLDISVYKGLTKVENPTLDADGFPEGDVFHASGALFDFTEEHFPGRTKGLERETYYTYIDSDGFRAGSYGGYNHWRNWLAQMAYDGHNAEYVWNDCQEGPFWELINFADNEGFIGSEVSAKLAKDFADHAEKAESWARAKIGGDNGLWFLEKYNDWRKAFEMAADNGAVDFH